MRRARWRSVKVTPPEILAARVRARRGDASDADVAVLERQLAAGTGAVTWQALDASGAPDAVLAAARSTLSDRAAAYGMPGVTVDGNDVWAVYQAAQRAVARARSGSRRMSSFPGIMT